MSNHVVFARMPEGEVELVKRVAKARGEDLSDFIRRAVYKELAELSFLSNDRKKALGLRAEKEGTCNDSRSQQ